MFLGVDPDLHDTGLAIVDKDGKVVWVGCCSILSAAFKGKDAVIQMAKALDDALANYKMLHVIVEGQTINFKQTRNPGDILNLAHVTGIAVGILVTRGWCSMQIPTPREWKGQVPKRIHHERILDSLGWKYKARSGYCVPISPPVDMGVPLRGSQWKHVVDAIGLARWGWKENEARSQQAAAVLAAREKEKD
jgi:hypothetical protein